MTPRKFSAASPVPNDLDMKIVAAIERLGHAVHKSLWDLAWQHGLSLTQAQVLLYLVALPDKYTTVAELSRRFNLKQSTVSDSVRVLLEKGLLERQRDCHDARVSRLRLSHRGQQLAQQLADWVTPLREEVKQLDEKIKATLLDVLLRLIAGLQRAGVIQITKTCTTCGFFEPNRYPDPAAPHHCRLLNRPLHLVELQVECPDHQPKVAPPS